MSKLSKLDVECAVPTAVRDKLTPAEVDAILEVVYLAMVADGVLAEEEADAFVRTMLRLLGPHATESRVRRIMQRFERRLERGEHCVAARCGRVEEVAKALRRKPARELAYKLAFVMSLSDLRTNESEFLFDQHLREALGIADDRADELSDEAAGAVIGDGTPHKPGSTTCPEPPEPTPIAKPKSSPKSKPAPRRRTPARRPRR
jgi:hypothetical protein